MCAFLGVRWKHALSSRVETIALWAFGRWVIGYGLLGIGDGLFQVFVYGIDANACREEAEGSYVAMVRVG